MKDEKKPLLGFCPIGKFVFSHEEAVRCKRSLESLLEKWRVPYIGIDEVVEDGMVRDVGDVSRVVTYLKSKAIDAVFMPHCNFGTEHAVGLVGRDLGVPVLVWAPRDEAPLPDGTRHRDSLCGLFASTKVLHKLGVPFSYIENCRFEDPALEPGVDTFLRAANAANTLRKGMRIGLIGQRIDFFWTTIVNESELLERFKVEVLPIDMVEFIRSVKEMVRKRRKEYENELSTLKDTITIKGFDDDEPILHILAVRDRMLELKKEHGLDGIAFQSFMSVIDELGAYCSLATSMTGDSLPVAMESDIHGAISDVLLQKAAFDTEPAFLADVTVRHPEKDNGVLLWHAGAPLSMCHPDVHIEIGHHWILPTPLSGMTHFRLKDGPITITRFDGDRGEYALAVGEGRSTEGPFTQNNYVWMEVDDWPRWERLLMEGPFIHHTGMVYGHYGDALIEACRFIPGLEPLRLDRKR